MTASSAAPPPQVWPTLRARDALSLIRFLVDVLGFEETVVYAEGDTVHHAELAWPLGGRIMLGSVRPAEGDEWPLQPGSFGAYVVVEDADALYARGVAQFGSALALGARGRGFESRHPDNSDVGCSSFPGQAALRCDHGCGRASGGRARGPDRAAGRAPRHRRAAGDRPPGRAG